MPEASLDPVLVLLDAHLVEVASVLDDQDFETAAALLGLARTLTEVQDEWELRLGAWHRAVADLVEERPDLEPALLALVDLAEAELTVQGCRESPPCTWCHAGEPCPEPGCSVDEDDDWWMAELEESPF